MLNGATTHELKTDAVKNEREREKKRKKKKWLDPSDDNDNVYNVATRKSSDWLWLCVCNFCLGYG